MQDYFHSVILLLLLKYHHINGVHLGNVLLCYLQYVEWDKLIMQFEGMLTDDLRLISSSSQN